MRSKTSLIFALIFIVFVIILAPAKSQAILNGPETIVYDSLGDRYFVSNMNTNYIVEIDRIGNHFIFNSEVMHPYGMTIMSNTLFVGADVGSKGGIFGFDLSTGEKTFELLSYSWYNSINGLTSDTSGNVYFACTGQSRIYKVIPSDSSYIPIAIIPIPNAIHYDAGNNRLLVTTNNWGSALYLIDLSDYSISTVPTIYGQFSGLTEDALHNIYVAYFAEGTIYKFDSTLIGPMELVSSGHSGPEGICFDKVHSTLCVPNLMANTVSFIPLEVNLWFDIDTVGGEVPFEVQFSGSSIYDISEWIWDFGDGTTAFGQESIHTYDIAGYYDVKLTAITNGDDTIRYVYLQYICAYADTLRAEDVTWALIDGLESIMGEVEINVDNSVPLNQLIVPIEYSGELDLSLDSVALGGCRTESCFDYQIINISVIDKRLTVKLTPPTGEMNYLDPGSGPVMRVCFHSNGPLGMENSIILDGYGANYNAEFSAKNIVYEPSTIDGSVRIILCGDANGDDFVNVSDAVHIINYVFVSGNPPDPLETGDANCDSVCNVSDAVWIINYVFVGGNVPCDTTGNGMSDC